MGREKGEKYSRMTENASLRQLKWLFTHLIKENKHEI